jgi:FkbM family methyltransferase
MPQLRELQDKVFWRIKNQTHAYALKVLDFRHILRSGYMIRVETYADWAIYNDIFVDQEYDVPISTILSSKRAGDRLTVLDLGANVGFFTLRVADLIHRMEAQALKPELVLVEGSPSAYRQLVKRINEQPTLQGKCRLVHGLVGERAGAGTIYEIAYHGMNSIVPRRFSRAVKVDFVNLDELCQSLETIDLIKCDIEGAEELFLRNYPQLLGKAKAMVVEFHHKAINYDECLKRLREAGLSARHQVLMNRDLISTEFFQR